MSPSGGDLVFVGDVHLDRDDPAVDDFRGLLARIAASTRRLVLAGDLFNLWIGQRGLESPHQRAVLSALADLRRRGVVVRYLEGNRDYRIGAAYAGESLDDVSDRGIAEDWGGRRLFAIHGDLANESDRPYRLWRRLSRSRLAWAAYNLLRQSRRMRFAEGLEARLRRTNLEHKRRFPEEAVRRYAARRFREGYDAVVLGHFHVEKDIAAAPPSPPGRILVLPEWRRSHRHLRVTESGEIAFVDSG